MKKAHLILAGLLLSFTLNAANDIPRPEYPRPQFERSEWINLNGEWTYEFDFSNSGKSRRLTIAKQFSNTITVPFCPESKLSGVNYTDFINQMWYQRPISIPSDWEGKKIILLRKESSRLFQFFNMLLVIRRCIQHGLTTFWS